MRSEFRSLKLAALSICAASLGVCALALYGVPAALAQQAAPQASQPSQSKPKTLQFKGEVVSANLATITVRSVQNPKVVMTFTYTPKVKAKMLAVIQSGGYQYGDKVTVTYGAGTTIAQNISGKPSKPKNP